MRHGLQSTTEGAVHDLAPAWLSLLPFLPARSQPALTWPGSGLNSQSVLPPHLRTFPSLLGTLTCLLMWLAGPPEGTGQNSGLSSS